MKKHKEFDSPWTVIATALSLAVVIAFFIIIGEVYTIYTGEGELKMDTTGQVGDFIGGVVGTTITGVSVILLYNTFIDQRTFSRTQTKYLEKNEIAQKDQQFQTTFFQLISSHTSLKQSILFNTKERLTWWTEEEVEPYRTISGIEFFEFAKWDFYRLYQPEGQIMPPISIRQDNVLEHVLPNPSTNHTINQPIERIKSKYKKFFDTYHPYLGHYFRNIYYILKHVDNHFEQDVALAQTDKDNIEQKYKFYTGTLQSQLSSAELFLLFYNGLCFSKMKQLIIKYDMLKNLAVEDLADSERHTTLYQGIALKTRHSIIHGIN
ncbi:MULTISPECIES: putative phage abortive infection protein [Olivibacter]|uniref:Phage abortive infection protein n=1 Tax=Olivibacter jilunii TaxID=985016 RepID=A0ABW6B2I7_9SPHI